MKPVLSGPTTIGLPAMDQKRTFADRSRRKSIVDCAIESLVECGYEGTSVGEIARRADVSKGVITYHFPLRAEILEQVLVRLCGELERWVRARTGRTRTAASTLRELISASIDFAGPHRDLAVALAELLRARQPGDNAVSLALASRRFLANDMAAILKWGQGTGEFRLVDPYVTGQAIRDAIDGFYARIAVERGIDARADGAEIAALFVAAVQRSARARRRERVDRRSSAPDEVAADERVLDAGISPGGRLAFGRRRARRAPWPRSGRGVRRRR